MQTGAGDGASVEAHARTWLGRHNLAILMLLHVMVWSYLWATKGEAIYAFMAGAAVASVVFMVAWVEIDLRHPRR